MWQHTATHIVVNCPEYRWELEEHRDDEGHQMLFAHIRVHKIVPGLLKRMKETFRLFRECVSAPLYAIAEHDDDKWEKFISHFGFKYLMPVVCENGEYRRLFVSLKEQEQQNAQPVLPEQGADAVSEPVVLDPTEPVGTAGAVSYARV